MLVNRRIIKKKKSHYHICHMRQLSAHRTESGASCYFLSSPFSIPDILCRSTIKHDDFNTHPDSHSPHSAASLSLNPCVTSYLCSGPETPHEATMDSLTLLDRALTNCTGKNAPLIIPGCWHCVLGCMHIFLPHLGCIFLFSIFPLPSGSLCHPAWALTAHTEFPSYLDTLLLLFRF